MPAILGTLSVRKLPRGRHGVPREFVVESQRGRMLAAMAEAVAEKGYARTVVSDVVGRAGVSRKTFYEHFANREECFLAAYDAGVALLLEAVDEAIAEAAPDPAAASLAGIERYLGVLADNPPFARTFLVDVLAAGPEALRRRAAVHRRFAGQVAGIYEAARRDRPDLPAQHEHVFHAYVGAVHELVSTHLVERGAETLPDLAGALLQVQLNLLGGPAAPRR